MARYYQNREDQYDTDDARYWAARERRLAADIKADAEYARSPQGRLHAAEIKVESMRAAAIDSGTYSDAQISAAEAERDAIGALVKAVTDAAFAAEWTLAVTTERRATWNALVKVGQFGRMGAGRTDWAAMRAQEKAQGWTMDALKQAIKRHNL